MTQDDVILMAREAKLPNSDLYHGNLAAFAKLVAEHEREACAKVCEQMGIDGYGTLAIAIAIRARSNSRGQE